MPDRAALRVLIVEDEPPSRDRLARLVAEAGAAVVAAVATVPDARAALARFVSVGGGCDVVLLDVELPGESGLALLSDLPAGVHVVFVTAYASHAVTAFDEGAADFVVKPVAPERLALALDRVGDRIRRRASPDPAAVARLASALRPPPSLPASIPSRRGDAVSFVALDRVTHFEARDKVVFAHTADGRAHIVEPTLGALAARLDRAFVQVSRAHLVARAHLVGARRVGSGRSDLSLTGGATVTSGPAYADAVAALTRW